MNSECLRIAGQLRRAFEGEAWHGPALRELLSNLSEEQACAHPLPSAHSIWELVLHITVWTRAALDPTRGQPLGKIVGTPEDWPVVTDSTPQAWRLAIEKLFESKDQLAAAIEQFHDARLNDIVPGRTYNFYYLFHGIVQHALYHAGQIAMLKK